MQPTLVINVVGLTQALLGEHTPELQQLAAGGATRAIEATCPAVTCTAQATYLTGKKPAEHGIVANGWYFRELSEIWFWRQSNRLVEGDKLWDIARRRNPEFTVANLFWWYNMYSSADFSVTPRPMYPSDGRKVPDVYAEPEELRQSLQARFGTFPLFKFWGPATDLSSSRWITDATLAVMKEQNPTLALAYIPHLDYCLQRLGPDLNSKAIQAELRDTDALCGELIAAARAAGRRVIVLSEYGITTVAGDVAINRVLRKAGLLRCREEMGRQMLDPGASQAFAVVDHQLAHVYVQDPARVSEVRALLTATPGVERVLGREEQAAEGLDHPRAGELIAISQADRWFSYYFWLPGELPPDFATTVDIHRKPGYDPVELFLDPKLRAPKLAVAYRLLKRAAGFRALLDVISADATELVKGSHGRPTDRPEEGPLLIAEDPSALEQAGVGGGSIPAESVMPVILAQLFGSPR